jgi:3-keto-5-aminohexanoate cleavage enzyme
MRKVWIEVALNGPWSRALQPGIPDTVEAIIAEGIACARAGAAIIHTHAYDGGGPQTFDWRVYARIIEGIRAEVDVPVYPSFPAFMSGSGDTGVAEAEARFSHIDALAARGLIEFAALDPGSVNFTQVATTSQANPAGTYLNPESHVRHALGIAGRHGFHPAFAIYEPGFIRAGAALARATGVKTPIYRFMFSQQFAFCFPPKPYALAALATLVEEEAGAAPWMISGLGVDVSPLIGEAVARGGHIRVGLEDALLGTPASTTNLGLVEAAVQIVRDHGAEPATPDDVRQALGAISDCGGLG